MSKQRLLLNSLVIISMVFSLLGVPLLAVPVALSAPAAAPEGIAWTAYHDCAWESGQIATNITTNTCNTASSWLLKKYSDGTNTTATATIAKNGTLTPYASNGAETASGTDAYTTFHGIADMTGVINYGSSTGWWVDVTFTGLDPAKTYTFATSANRAGTGGTPAFTTRVSRYTISDVTTATNASTTGVTVTTTSLTNDTSAFVTGNNTTAGYVARWTGIQPGADGDFKVRAQANGTVNEAYGFGVFMLAEETTGPTITTSGTLSAFTTQPGVPSAAQTYTVSGINLTSNINVLPPTGFELSTNGTTYSSSLELTPTSGSVSATTIYVRLTGMSAGTFSGNITHTSAGANTVNVAVSGTTGIVTVRVNQGSDDAEQNASTGAMDLSSTDLELIYDTADQFVGMRFQNVQVPAGVTILSAYIEFETDETTDQNPSALTINGQAADNPTTFTTAASSISNRSLTTASVAWSPGAWDTVDVKHQTPDIATIVQEIVDRGGWASGNAMAFIVEGTGRRVAEAYEGESAAAPLLVINYTVSTDPAITITGALSAFSSLPGVPSTAQTYNVTGRNLSADISINPPTGFQLSTDDTNWYSSLTLTRTGTVVPATTIYVRLYSAADGTFSGNIAHTSSGATTRNVAASGTASSCLDASLTAAEDTYLSAADVTFNNGGNTELHVDNTTDTARRTTLLKWDVSSIPSNSTVTSATLSLYVSDASPLTFNLYNMRRTWVEGNLTRTASTTSTNWNTWNGIATWGLAGVISTTLDRYDTNLWSAGTTSFSTTGSKAEALNANGVAVVQGWISGTLSNYGLTIQNYSGSTSNAVYFSSSENTTVANRPRLNIHYCVPAVPTINTSGTLTPFSTTPGVSSAEQSYTVSGYNLTDDINISAPANFELSAESADMASSPDGAWSSNLLLYQTGGLVEPINIYVRLNSATVGTFSGNITHTSIDAAQVNVPVSGSALPLYTLTVGNDGNGTVTLSPAGGSYISGTTVTLTPVPNSGYVLGSWSGANDGDIVNTNGVYTIMMDGDKSITVNFVTATCSTVNLTATEDTYVSAADVQYNNGGNTVIHVDATTGTSRRAALLRWNVSGIPSNAIVSSASISMYVSDPSPLLFNLYNMRRDWVEGTSSQATSSTSANWNTYNGTNSWGTVGISNPTSDRYDTNLWNATTSSFSTDESSATVTLNANGVGVVQGWINGALSNYGLTMQNYYGSTSNAVYFSSSENGTVANRPRLNVTYCVASTGPIINTTSSLSAFSSNIGVASAEQSYTVAGNNLTNDIVLTAPADFQISTTSGSGFGSTITLSHSGGTVPSATIYVRFLRSTAGTSSGNITHVSAGATQVNVPVSGTALNGAPTIALVQPANGATGVSTSPTMEVTVTDPDADVSTVSFYGRPVGSGSGEDFTIIVIPDAQNYATSYPSVYTNHLQWIATNKTVSNTVFATAVGDLVNTATSSTEYGRADTAFDTLDAGNVSYSVGPGNHDMTSGTLWPSYFGTSRFSGKSYYGGTYDDYNNYYLFSAAGMDFIVINLQYGPTTAILNWADALLKANPTRRAIVEQHNILNTDNSWNSQTSFTALKDNPNLFLMLCGHMHTGSDGAAYRAELGDDGHPIHIVMADYQDFAGSGYLRILRFSPSANTIYMTTYSPISGSSITTDPDQKNLAYIMASSEPYTLIGTVSGVASGSNASVNWPGRATNQAYEWYAVANDGSTNTTSATWNFTTTATPLVYTLTTNVVGTGTVTKNPDATSYTSGSVVTLTATPGTGYVFSSWSGDLSGSTNPMPITMNANRVVTATFLAVVTRTLSSGWNLIALPLQPTTTLTAESLLVDIANQGGTCSEVSHWLNNSAWNTHIMGSPRNIFNLVVGEAYFVNCTGAPSWQLRGTPLSASVPVDLAIGWNLLSVPYPTGLNAQGVLDGITLDGGTCSDIDRWDGASWVAHLNGSVRNNFAIAPNDGYFVNCSGGTIYQQ